MKNIILPGSKSITNRDFILASLTDSKTILKGILLSDDTHYMMKALKNIGINIKLNGDIATIYGGITKIKGNNKKLYIGQSGTCMRFLTALIILNKIGTITLTGEKRLLERPMGDLFNSLKQMGIKFESNGDLPPIKVFPSKIKKKKIKMNGSSSSQFFTALLQIAPLLDNGLEIEVIGDLVSKPYIDLTINEIKKFGINIENRNYKKFIINSGKYKPGKLTVEGDASALSYIANFIVLHGGKIKINNIGTNSKQGDYKYLNTLKIFGLNYTSNGETTIMKASGIKNRHSEFISESLKGKNINNDSETSSEGELKGQVIDFENMPDVSMSYMSLAIFLPGNTKITGLQTLNLKECKRIDVMSNELKKLGVKIKSDEKSITIGKFDFNKYKDILKKQTNIDIETYNDHRIAMVFGILNTFIGGLNILNPKCVEKTYPNFWENIKILIKK